MVERVLPPVVAASTVFRRRESAMLHVVAFPARGEKILGARSHGQLTEWANSRYTIVERSTATGRTPSVPSGPAHTVSTEPIVMVKRIDWSYHRPG